MSFFKDLDLAIRNLCIHQETHIDFFLEDESEYIAGIVECQVRSFLPKDSYMVTQRRDSGMIFIEVEYTKRCEIRRKERFLTLELKRVPKLIIKLNELGIFIELVFVNELSSNISNSTASYACPVCNITKLGDSASFMRLPILLVLYVAILQYVGFIDLMAFFAALTK